MIGLTLKILGGLAALGLGLWLGRPGYDHRDRREIEEALTKEGPRRRKTVDRTFTPMDWLRRSGKKQSSRRNRGRRTFETVLPELKDEAKKRSEGSEAGEVSG